MDILDSGINIVQLSPETIFRHERSDMFDIMRAVMELSRGHGESEIKSQRNGATWEEKRKAARTGDNQPPRKKDGRVTKALTNQLPAWIEDADGMLKLIPERATAVHRIFVLAAEGLGGGLIVKKLKHEQRYAIGPSGLWSRAYVSLILKDRRARVIRKTIEYLAQQGWPAGLLSDSGNGYHGIYRIDLPRDDGGIVERCLKALAHRFDTERAKIDQTVFNPSRICKMLGTMARKGDSIEFRPHRQAKILEVPEGVTEYEQLVPVPRELLEALAAEAPTETATPPKIQATHASNGHTANGQGNGEYTSKLDIPRWLNDRA